MSIFKILISHMLLFAFLAPLCNSANANPADNLISRQYSNLKKFEVLIQPEWLESTFRNERLSTLLWNINQAEHYYNESYDDGFYYHKLKSSVNFCTYGLAVYNAYVYYYGHNYQMSNSEKLDKLEDVFYKMVLVASTCQKIDLARMDVIGYQPLVGSAVEKFSRFIYEDTEDSYSVRQQRLERCYGALEKFKFGNTSPYYTRLKRIEQAIKASENMTPEQRKQEDNPVLDESDFQ